MFDFEKLKVYAKAKAFNHRVGFIIRERKVDRITRDQLKRASFSIMLNIAEGTSRFSNPDKKNFYIIARGSAFECVVVFDFLKEQELISKREFSELYEALDEISKMLFSLIRRLE